jgi:hypothetical protein
MGIRDGVRIKDVTPEELCLLFWHDPECARKILGAGVSPAFVANVFAENREEPGIAELGNEEFTKARDRLLDALIPIAVELGEFECEDSGCYYTLNDAEIDSEGVPRCPECGGVLRSSVCAFCGEPLRKPEVQDFKGNWLFLGRPFLGFYFCPTCWAEIQREKTYQLFAAGWLKKTARLAKAV